MIRLIIIVLLVLGPMPFRVCTCGAEHAMAVLASDQNDRNVPYIELPHHDHDCPMAKAKHLAPAVIQPTGSWTLDLDVSACPFEAHTPIESFFSSVPHREQNRLPDWFAPLWLIQLSMQI